MLAVILLISSLNLANANDTFGDKIINFLIGSKEEAWTPVQMFFDHSPGFENKMKEEIESPSFFKNFCTKVGIYCNYALTAWKDIDKDIDIETWTTTDQRFEKKLYRNLKTTGKWPKCDGTKNDEELLEKEQKKDGEHWQWEDQYILLGWPPHWLRKIVGKFCVMFFTPCVLISWISTAVATAYSSSGHPAIWIGPSLFYVFFCRSWRPQCPREDSWIKFYIAIAGFCWALWQFLEHYSDFEGEGDDLWHYTAAACWGYGSAMVAMFLLFCHGICLPKRSISANKYIN